MRRRLGLNRNKRDVHLAFRRWCVRSSAPPAVIIRDALLDDPLSDVINNADVGEFEPFVEHRKSELMTIWLDRRPAGIQTIDWST